MSRQGAFRIFAADAVAPMLPLTANDNVVPENPSEALDAAMTDAVKQSIVANACVCSLIAGGGFGGVPFQEHAPDGLLIGMRVCSDNSSNRSTVSAVQAIYLTPAGIRLGAMLGNPDGSLVTLLAKPGYAVGGATLRGGGGMDAVTLMYLKIAGQTLDPSDSYASNTVGGMGGGQKHVDGQGVPVIGIVGKHDKNGGSPGVGLIFLRSPAHSPN